MVHWRSCCTSLVSFTPSPCFHFRFTQNNVLWLTIEIGKNRGFWATIFRIQNFQKTGSIQISASAYQTKWIFTGTERLFWMTYLPWIGNDHGWLFNKLLLSDVPPTYWLAGTHEVKCKVGGVQTGLDWARFALASDWWLEIKFWLQKLPLMR